MKTTNEFPAVDGSQTGRSSAFNRFEGRDHRRDGLFPARRERDDRKPLLIANNRLQKRVRELFFIGTKGILLDQFLKIAFFPEKHTFYRIIPRFIETNELLWNRN